MRWALVCGPICRHSKPKTGVTRSHNLKLKESQGMASSMVGQLCSRRALSLWIRKDIPGTCWHLQMSTHWKLEITEMDRFQGDPAVSPKTCCSSEAKTRPAFVKAQKTKWAAQRNCKWSTKVRGEGRLICIITQNTEGIQTFKAVYERILRFFLCILGIQIHQGNHWRRLLVLMLCDCSQVGTSPPRPHPP